MNRGVVHSVLIVFVLTAVWSCREKSPSRDYIPIIKQRVYEVQEAIKSRGRNAIDSLLTQDYAAAGGADSLVQFTNGSDPTFVFNRFAHTEIYYTNDKARVDCLIMGKDSRNLRSATLTFERKKDVWLLKQITPGMRPMESILADSVL
ncbi:hypothetical protein C3F09_12175 [candidate division GN15 bacterium]|uniref:DUF4878 domain-containing protein n=1 Tax=candidate division GN15 bacterium TaxID=2072418 RepID=A0A855X372_9BACT|nr:MAG: hypothetical protein C3F09_12175 [candidate division GN15 bacterium]